MKNASRLVWISLAAIGSAIAANCTTTTETQAPARALGKVGESCRSRDDCDALSCINNVCTVEGQAASDGGVAVALSQAGESCRARADCTLGLACVNQVCVTPGSTPDAALQTGVGDRGESCQTRADCAAGLACVSGTCAIANYGLTPTSKECVASECKVPKDCCPEEPASCRTYRAQCEADAGDAGDAAYYCNYVQTYCTCDESRYACSADKCVTKNTCGGDGGTTCAFGTVCNGTACVQCVKNADCPNFDDVCMAEKCVRKCTYDTDCPYFNKCQGGACLVTGCKSDRECIANTGSVLSTCDTASGKCRIPCANDRECASVNNFSHSYSICVEGHCQDPGCETDEECRNLFQVQLGSGTTKYVECRPKVK